MASKTTIITASIALAALGTGIILGATFFANTSHVSPTPSPSPSPAVTASPSTSPAPNAASAGNPAAGTTGTIQGKKVFPAEGLPSDFRTCAANVTTGQQACSTAGGPTYSLQVPAGRYQVYAVVPSFDPNYRAYYSKFVTCGLRADCSDHTPITVTVSAGQTLTGIDVGDFYTR